MSATDAFFFDQRRCVTCRPLLARALAWRQSDTGTRSLSTRRRLAEAASSQNGVARKCGIGGDAVLFACDSLSTPLTGSVYAISARVNRLVLKIPFLPFPARFGDCPLARFLLSGWASGDLTEAIAVTADSLALARHHPQQQEGRED
jgi:hypothetical protein